MKNCRNCGYELNNERFCPKCGADQDIKAATPSNNDAQENKVMAILAYLGVLVFIPMFAAPNSRFARFHTNQGLTLFVAEIAYGIIYWLLNMVLWRVSFNLWWTLMPILGMLYIVFGVFVVLGIVNAVQGNEKELPLIGKIQLRK